MTLHSLSRGQDTATSPFFILFLGGERKLVNRLVAIVDKFKGRRRIGAEGGWSTYSAQWHASC